MGERSEYILEPLQEKAGFTLYRGRERASQMPILAVASIETQVIAGEEMTARNWKPTAFRVEPDLKHRFITAVEKANPDLLIRTPLDADVAGQEVRREPTNYLGNHLAEELAGVRLEAGRG